MCMNVYYYHLISHLFAGYTSVYFKAQSFISPGYIAPRPTDYHCEPKNLHDVDPIKIIYRSR
jgi:hypothetical protein